MDQATQQNAALVEEMAAAASSLKAQAQRVGARTVAVFKLENEPQHGNGNTLPFSAVRAPQTGSLSPKSRAAQPPLRMPAKATTQRAIAKPAAPKAPTAGSDADWETF